jgi:uncharacterized protein (TIGR02996 family)
MASSYTMSNTLDALHRAVIENPADRTVRLVYADALEEIGGPAQLARAEFIRTQLELETLDDDSDQHGQLRSRARELFESNWFSWWAPIAEAAKLPYPHVPGKRRRDPPTPGVRRPRRKANWPYSHTTADTTVELAEYGLSFKFVGGFPEEVRFRNFDDPEGGPVLVHQWSEAIPLSRLAFTFYISAGQWERVDGPHLSRLCGLTFEALLTDVAQRLASSQHLAALTHLSANIQGSDPAAIRALVSRPPWTGLRILDLSGRVSVEGVHALARSNTLGHLEELNLSLGNPGILTGPAGELISSLLQAFAQFLEFPGGRGPAWTEFGPALEALAANVWVRRLRVLRIVSGHHTGLFGRLRGRLSSGTADEVEPIPNSAVLALASAVSTHKLERLVLSAPIIGPSIREELTSQLGPRVAFV